MLDRHDAGLVIVGRCRAIGARARVPASGTARSDGRDVREHGRTRGPSRTAYSGDTITTMGAAAYASVDE